MDSVVSWFILTVSGAVAVGWLLYQLYEHDYAKHEEKNCDYWS